MRNPYYQGSLSDHFDGTRFFNPGLAPSDKSLFEVLRWRVFGRRHHWPAQVPAVCGVHPEELVYGLRITAIGHASLLIQAANCNILLDPVWANRASPSSHFGPRRRNAPAIALSHLPCIHVILLTHNHYDHMDLATIAWLWRRDQPLVVCPLGNDGVIQAKAPQVLVKTGDWWDRFQLANDVAVTIVPSYHWSSRRLTDRRMALWGGFFLETPQKSVYCAGDTAYRDGKIFKEIRARLGPPDVAILPIGAYAPRWFMSTQHVDPEESIQIALECEAKHVLGVHWGTFELTDEPYGEPEERLYAAAKAASLKADHVLALRPGTVWHE